MLSLTHLADLAHAQREALDRPVRPVTIGGVTHDTDSAPLLMGVVNLSRDSTYRDSVAPTGRDAVRRARIMWAQGARLVDVGAESSTQRAGRVAPKDQIQALVPVIEQLGDEGIATSVEAYSPEVVRACLKAGASAINLTGGVGLEPIYEAAAEHGAAVVMCFVPGANVREVADMPRDGDLTPALIEHFAPRLARAEQLGVTEVVIDPGLGFFYGNLTEPMVRARHQTRALLESFRLRELGVPICQSLPHAYDLFQEEFRTAEGFFTVLALLGQVGVLRTHEVGHVSAVVRAMQALGTP